MRKGKGSKDNVLTFIQVVCAFAVVTLHTNGKFWTFSATERYWATANVIECVLYFAVPIFFMITGITLIDYQERYSTKEYFKRRIWKVFIPYIAWSLFGVEYRYYNGWIETVSLKYVVNSLLSGNAISVYWFFPVLFCVYLSLPLFAAVDKEKRRSTFAYLLCAALLVNVCIPFVISVFNVDVNWSYSVGAAAGYLIWIVGGYCLYWYPPKRSVKRVILCLSIIGLALHVVGTYRCSMKAGSIVQTYKGYNNLPCVLYSPGVFIVLEEIGKRVMKIELLKKGITFLGSYTFALYLLHWYVMNTISRTWNIDTRSIIWRLGAPVVIVGIVIGITCVLRKIPVVRKIVP